MSKSRHRRSRFTALMLLLALCLGLFQTSVSEAANIRGRIDAFNPYINNYVPTGGVMVTLFHEQGPNNWVAVGQTMTDGYGFYYFSNLYHGSYRIGPTLDLSMPLLINNYNLWYNIDIPIIRL